MTGATWETCEIDIESRADWRGTITRFVAVAVGPKGRYTVATSEEWRGWAGTDRYPTHLDPLIRRVLAEGWESDGKGTSDWGYRFRRRVGGAAAESGAGVDPLQPLKYLIEAHRAGELTDAEFAAAKARLLGL